MRPRLSCFACSPASGSRTVPPVEAARGGAAPRLRRAARPGIVAVGARFTNAPRDEAGLQDCDDGACVGDPVCIVSAVRASARRRPADGAGAKRRGPLEDAVREAA